MKRIIKYTLLVGFFPTLILLHHGLWAYHFGRDLALTPPASYSIYSTSGERLEFDSATGTQLPDDFGPVEAAVIASEDTRFLARQGAFDLRAFCRATVHTLQKDPEGGSTIPMQLTRIENTWLRKPEKQPAQFLHHWLKLLTRKAIEVSFGNCALKNRGHRRVLRDYLRRVPAPTMGIEASSWAIFERPSKNLTMEEAEALVNLLPSPTKNIKKLSKTTPKWKHPYASLAVNPQLTGEILHFEAQYPIYNLCHRTLKKRRYLKDVAVIIMREEKFVTLIETTSSPTRRPWRWSSHGSIRINSISKPLTVEYLHHRYGLPITHFRDALTYSLNAPFTSRSRMIEKKPYFSFLKTHYAMHATGDWSPLGRWHCKPIELLHIAGSDKNTLSRTTKNMMHDCLTKGTGKRASRYFIFPPSAWMKTGSSPSLRGRTSEILVLGEDGSGHQILIWGLLKKNAPHHLTAGQVLAPLFGEISKELSKKKHTLYVARKPNN